MNDPFDLQRFVTAQDGVYSDVLTELHQGEKRTHWMWFIFPQVSGLGHGSNSKYYAIQSREEADAYLAHPVLNSRLCECTELVLAVQNRSVSQIFGPPDDIKFHSCMTLFERNNGNVLFVAALARFYNSQPDQMTLEIMRGWAS